MVVSVGCATSSTVSGSASSGLSAPGLNQLWPWQSWLSVDSGEIAWQAAAVEMTGNLFSDAIGWTCWCNSCYPCLLLTLATTIDWKQLISIVRASCIATWHNGHMQCYPCSATCTLSLLAVSSVVHCSYVLMSAVGVYSASCVHSDSIPVFH